MARQFNLIPPICEQAEYHMFQREKVEVQLPELFHKIGGFPALAPPLSSPSPRPSPALLQSYPESPPPPYLPSPSHFRPGPAPLTPCCSASSCPAMTALFCHAPFPSPCSFSGPWA